MDIIRQIPRKHDSRSMESSSLGVQRNNEKALEHEQMATVTQEARSQPAKEARSQPAHMKLVPGRVLCTPVYSTVPSRLAGRGLRGLRTPAYFTVPRPGKATPTRARPGGRLVYRAAAALIN